MLPSLPRKVLAAVACALVITPGAALAALGADTRSVVADRLELKASVRTLAVPLYTVHELQLPGGTVIREFVSASGTVFAITWLGPFMPDLRQTLGVYFEPYQAAVRANRSGRLPVAVTRPDLVVNSAGHLRAFLGQVYLPQALPPGVTADELR